MLQNLPIAARLYADKILLVVVIILAIVMLIRWRINAAQERVLGAAEALSSARSSLFSFRQLNPLERPAQLADLRNQIRRDTERALETVSRDAASDDVVLRSQALLTKADLYWALANFPDIPGATTQPS